MSSDNSVQAVQQHNRFRRSNSKVNTSRGPPKFTCARTCYRCESEQHTANFPGCPAKDAVCRNCNKTGHFAKICRGNKRVSEITVPEVTVLNVEHSARDCGKIMCTVQICASTGQTRDIQLMVDTGSAVSILPMSVYTGSFSQAPLSQPKLSLVSFGGNPIEVKGCLPASISYGGHCTTTHLYIVQNGSAVLGRDLFTELSLQLRDGQVSTDQCTHTASSIDAKSENRLGCARGFMHCIHLRSGVQPVQQKLRRLPFSIRNEVSMELQKLVKQDVIEPVDASEWVSSIVVTIKKDGGIRLCVDLREPNKAVVVDSFPLPHMEEMFVNLCGATVFSTLDLQSAYHQVTLHEDSRNLTAFITHDGLFRYKRVPYGLASAPSCFQRMMSEILKGQSGEHCYLDDIMVAGASLKEHDENLQAVLQRINEAGLKLNMTKCHFRKTALSFLGHTFSEKGLQPDASHVSAVSDAPPPADEGSLRSFLGLTSWYSKFIPNYATVVEPLRVLLRGSTPFVWSSEAQESFETVKGLIVNSAALALFNPELPTIVTTDASDYGMGGVLTQIHADNSERTVAFASRTLTTAERKYSTVEKEALACIWPQSDGGPTCGDDTSHCGQITAH